MDKLKAHVIKASNYAYIFETNLHSQTSQGVDVCSRGWNPLSHSSY